MYLPAISSSDRRYKAAVELAARGDFAAAADVLMQTVEVAPLRDAMAAAGLKLVALELAAIRAEKGTPVAGACGRRNYGAHMSIVTRR